QQLSSRAHLPTQPKRSETTSKQFVAATCRDSGGITSVGTPTEPARLLSSGARGRALRDSLQAGDLPDPAAALVGPSKPVILQHPKHRVRRGGKAPKAASCQPHHQVEAPVEGAREQVRRG